MQERASTSIEGGTKCAKERESASSRERLIPPQARATVTDPKWGDPDQKREGGWGLEPHSILAWISPSQAERGEATERVPNRHLTVYSWFVAPDRPQDRHLFCFFSLSLPSRRARSTSRIYLVPLPKN